MLLFGYGVQQDMATGKAILDNEIYTNDVGVLSSLWNAIKLSSERDFATSERVQSWLKKLWLNGDVNALFYLGVFTEKVQKNDRRAIDLYIEAANDGVDPAVVNVGLHSLADWMQKREKDFSLIVSLKGDIAIRTAKHMEFKHSFNNCQLLNIPAGLNNYGLAILEILYEFTHGKHSLANDRDVLEFLVDKYFKHEKWYKIRKFGMRPAGIFHKIVEERFQSKTEVLLFGDMYRIMYRQ